MFITLEGIEGAGKTTQLSNIVAFVESKGRECVTTREPGGTSVGEQIRAILLDPSNHDLDVGAELLLYIADRIQHLRTVIQPHLAANRVVLCDRFFDATLVYQGYARGLELETIRSLHRLTCDDFQPNVTLLFDLEPKVGLSRAWRQIRNRDRSSRETRFEQEKIEFHRKVRAGYLDLARSAPERFRIIDAGQEEHQVGCAVQKALEPFF